MKKLLILNGSHSDIPLIQSGKKMGYYVITTGNNPRLIGHKYADEYHYADYSNKDWILTLSKKLNIDAICSCANDFGAITASYVAEKMGLPGHDSYETSLILHEKDRFKEFSKEYNILTPIADSYNNIESAMNNLDKYTLPVIVKPVDLSGGKGITKVISYNEFKDAIKKSHSMSHAGKFVIEPFIEGTYHSFSTFVVNHKVVAHFSDNEYSYMNPFLVSTSAAPATDIQYVEDILLKEANKIITILNLTDGVFHIQYVMKNHIPYILEITRRCSGDCYPEPVSHSLEIPWAEWIVRAESGMDCSMFPKNTKQKYFCGRHCIMGNKNGIVKDVIISDEIADNIYKRIFWWKSGFAIQNYKIDKLGIVFLQYKSETEMLSKINRINELIKVIYK